jgi:hypothetical protein
MLEYLGDYSLNVPNRVYFFDDNPNHILKYQIPENNYILITPPFESDFKDATDYSPIYYALGLSTPFEFKGGKRRSRSRNRKSRRGRRRNRNRNRNRSTRTKK